MCQPGFSPLNLISWKELHCHELEVIGTFTVVAMRQRIFKMSEMSLLSIIQFGRQAFYMLGWYQQLCSRLLITIVEKSFV